MLLPNGTHSEMCWPEPENYWLGLREADLIRMGARYPPCMRHDPKLYEQITQRQVARDRTYVFVLRAFVSTNQCTPFLPSSRAMIWFLFSSTRFLFVLSFSYSSLRGGVLSLLQNNSYNINTQSFTKPQWITKLRLFVFSNVQLFALKTTNFWAQDYYPVARALFFLHLGWLLFSWTFGD